jgi:putative lipoic acid-binding regulatory protein
MDPMEPDTPVNRPLIEYPCRWEYKTIGMDEALMRAAVAEVMADLEHELSFSRASGGGKYSSLLIVVDVENEDHRNSIFNALQQHRDIRMVL